MEIRNLSAEPLGKLHAWIPHDLKAEEFVFLPDACPGKSPLPTGTAVLTRQEDWRRFAISDCGCGMRLLRSSVPVQELDAQRWNTVAHYLRENKGRLGDLGGGNHFLDALAPYEDGPVYFLIHTGSRNESGPWMGWLTGDYSQGFGTVDAGRIIGAAVAYVGRCSVDSGEGKSWRDFEFDEPWNRSQDGVE